MVYPASYGFVPGTLCEDGDPLDILVISPEPIKRATVVETKILGVLDMDDEGEKDYKLVGVPNFYTRQYANLKDLEESFLQFQKTSSLTTKIYLCLAIKSKCILGMIKNLHIKL